MDMAAASTDTGGAGQPSKTDKRKLSPLPHLTAQSARICLCDVVIYNATEILCTCLPGGKKTTTHAFQCILVCTSRCLAHAASSLHVSHAWVQAWNVVGSMPCGPTRFPELRSKINLKYRHLFLCQTHGLLKTNTLGSSLHFLCHVQRTYPCFQFVIS